MRIKTHRRNAGARNRNGKFVLDPLKRFDVPAGACAGKGLLLDPCPQIHTCFMRFAIDAVFFDKNGRVLYVAEQMKPWRFSRFVRGSRYTLELAGGTLAGRVKSGDEVTLIK